MGRKRDELLIHCILLYSTPFSLLLHRQSVLDFAAVVGEVRLTF